MRWEVSVAKKEDPTKMVGEKKTALRWWGKKRSADMLSTLMKNGQEISKRGAEACALKRATPPAWPRPAH